jgi:hypothetical protein
MEKNNTGESEMADNNLFYNMKIKKIEIFLLVNCLI